MTTTERVRAKIADEIDAIVDRVLDGGDPLGESVGFRGGSLEAADRILALIDSGEPTKAALREFYHEGYADALTDMTGLEEPEITTGRDEAIRQINGDYDEPQETLYPCAHPGCTRVRTRAEGGDTFTVCDKHWGSPEPDARYVVVTEEDEAMLVTLAEHFDTKADNYERTGPVARWVEGFLSRVGPEPRVEPVAWRLELLHEPPDGWVTQAVTDDYDTMRLWGDHDPDHPEFYRVTPLYPEPVGRAQGTDLRAVLESIEAEIDLADAPADETSETASIGDTYLSPRRKTMSERDPDAAWTHFNNRVRDKVEGEYGEFTNADWQAAVAMREEIKRLRSEPPPEAGEQGEPPDELWYFDDLSDGPHRWWRDGDTIRTQPECDEAPEQLLETAPQSGWCVFDGEIVWLTEADLADDDHPAHWHYEKLRPGDEWWSGRFRQATDAEVVAFFGLASPPPSGEPSRTPIADALHEAYMSGYNDAGTEQDALDADAFTEAGVALSRMFASPPPSSEPTEAEGARCICEWAHPVDGSIDPTWPAELDPTCPVHGTPTESHSTVEEALPLLPDEVTGAAFDLIEAIKNAKADEFGGVGAAMKKLDRTLDGYRTASTESREEQP